MIDLRKNWVKKSSVHLAVWLAVLALVGWSLVWAEFDLRALFRSGPRFTDFFSRMTPPDWKVSELILKSTVETLMIALAGTAISVVFSLPLGFLAASNVSPSWVAQPIRWMLGFIRSIPLIVVAILFVSAVGLGPFPGTLAVAFHSMGMLGKFYAEEFETADEGILNAVGGTGATWTQTLRYGLFPQCVPQVVSFTIYRFEMNFRDAAVLGFVGAGGIGFYIQQYARGFQYEKVAVLVIVIVGVVTLLDQLTFWVRKWIR